MVECSPATRAARVRFPVDAHSTLLASVLLQDARKMQIIISVAMIQAPVVAQGAQIP